MTGPYAAYVLSAYGIAGAGIVGLLAWAFFDRRAARAALARAERAAGREGQNED